jgi:hypothetical protein
VIKPTRLTGVYKNMPRGIIALMFVAEVVSGKLRTTDETSQVEWWEHETIKDRMDPAFAVRLLDALRHDGPAVRAHDGVSLLPSMAALPRDYI